MHDARYWHRRDDGALACDLCPHGCVLRDDMIGICKSRAAHGGKLTALGYGLISSAHVDPIEKKPLYHFHPGTSILSIGGWGCNFQCEFCQNWTISQTMGSRGGRHSPEDVARLAGSAGSIGVAYTYNEPVINFEFVMDCARRIRDAGFLNVLVTNGSLNPEPAAELLPWIDALNIDIKSMEEGFYKTHCKGKLAPVLAFAEQARTAKRHLEITNLLIPGLNDDARQVAMLADWVAEHLGASTPLHLSAYRPEYMLRIPPTPAASLQRAFEICRRKLSYVYLGNLSGSEGQSTECPGCGSILVRRQAYSTEVCGMQEKACSSCGRRADFVL